MFNSNYFLDNDGSWPNLIYNRLIIHSDNLGSYSRQDHKRLIDCSADTWSDNQGPAVMCGPVSNNVYREPFPKH